MKVILIHVNLMHRGLSASLISWNKVISTLKVPLGSNKLCSLDVLNVLYCHNLFPVLVT